MSDNFEINQLHLSNMIDDDSEFIPLLSSEDEDSINNEKLPEELQVEVLKAGMEAGLISR